MFALQKKKTMFPIDKRPERKRFVKSLSTYNVNAVTNSHAKLNRLNKCHGSTPKNTEMDKNYTKSRDRHFRVLFGTSLEFCKSTRIVDRRHVLLNSFYALGMGKRSILIAKQTE
ncbi:hypothetical protein CDAR_93051 [Caerostris darwini]|uniref:Uncharacterized protein n=1 Tax=Caerostris darwini TaxID=1538125 RepID=A0AAV4WF31_9ARAC|nr:hypothetical protein CDAR_93051 [Caerostris darwini]